MVILLALFSWVEAHSYKSGVQPRQSTIDRDLPAARSYPAAAGWAALAVLSVAIAVPLVWLKVPAALFLAPMLAAIALAVGGGSLDMPSWIAVAAQGLIGCMIAR